MNIYSQTKQDQHISLKAKKKKINYTVFGDNLIEDKLSFESPQISITVVVHHSVYIAFSRLSYFGISITQSKRTQFPLFLRLCTMWNYLNTNKLVFSFFWYMKYFHFCSIKPYYIFISSTQKCMVILHELSLNMYLYLIIIGRNFPS